jgi:ABC-type hemin transport system ATPase subunit
MTDYAIRADGLAKTFGRTTALRDVSLRVPPGTVCALLGRNGAGKPKIGQRHFFAPIAAGSGSRQPTAACCSRWVPAGGGGR